MPRLALRTLALIHQFCPISRVTSFKILFLMTFGGGGRQFIFARFRRSFFVQFCVVLFASKLIFKEKSQERKRGEGEGGTKEDELSSDTIGVG